MSVVGDFIPKRKMDEICSGSTRKQQEAAWKKISHFRLLSCLFKISLMHGVTLALVDVHIYLHLHFIYSYLSRDRIVKSGPSYSLPSWTIENRCRFDHSYVLGLESIEMYHYFVRDSSNLLSKMIR